MACASRNLDGASFSFPPPLPVSLLPLLDPSDAIADRKDLEFTYSLIDRIFRLSLGELADFSGAKYDGDFSLTLEQAQGRKHDYVAEQIGIRPGRRVLDLGSGWGALLNYIRARGGSGLGVTLSSAQATACERHGLDARLHDAREVTGETFGEFDAVASLGAFEHFCSQEEYWEGRQEEIYRELFARMATVPLTGPPTRGSTAASSCPDAVAAAFYVGSLTPRGGWRRRGQRSAGCTCE